MGDLDVIKHHYLSTSMSPRTLCSTLLINDLFPITHLMKHAGNLSNTALCCWCCREADLRGVLLGLGETVLQQVNKALGSQGGAALPQENQDLLKGQISDLWKHNHPVRTLIGQMIND